MKSLILSLFFFLSTVFCFGQNPILVKDIYEGPSTSGIKEIVQTSNLTFFNAYDFNNGSIRGLFRTDGTEAGTYKINFQSPGYVYGKAEKITALGDNVIFAGNNYSKNGEIWVSDGTVQGTILLDRLQPTVDIIPVGEIVAMGNYAYYTVVGNNNTTVLKKTDGTLSGTTTVFDFGTILNLPMVGLLAPINGLLYFNVYDVTGTGFDQLWRSDGSASGTYLVKNFGAGNSVASKPMQAGSFFYIMMVETGVANVLWKSDGTTAGTNALKVISSRPQDLANNIYPSFAAIGSTLYFAGLNENGMELWKSDGTIDGTGLAIDLFPGTSGSSPSNLTVLKGNLYFSGKTPDAGIELCRFDGVDANVVADIYPGIGIGFSTYSGMVVSNGVLLFSGYTPKSAWELWMSDGMETTSMVADLNPGPVVGGAGFLTSGNTVYFTGSNGSAKGVELFKFDNAAGLSGLHKVYVNDNNLTGDQFVSAVGNDANTGSVSSPLATISHAISIANPGDTIIVDAGSYEGQIHINKSVSIRGAGKALTKILEPAGTLAGANLEGGFNETALILASQGLEDVSIENIGLIGTGNFNAQHGILIQGGGQVLNCEFDKLNNGIFFRDATGSGSTALVQGNDMKGLGYVGVNFQGNYMMANMSNNTIDLAGSNYGMGVIAGGDFGALQAFEASNNSISNFNGFGLTVDAGNSILNYNSIVGSKGYALAQTGATISELNCNWFGTSSLFEMMLKVNGQVNINSILSSGVDAASGTIGFQIDESNCIQPPPQFYVNDNSTEGDKFSIAIGDDNNPGTKEAPFATVRKALSVIAPGDYVFVDAGTYAEKVFFGKSTNMIGAGADLVKFFWPTNITPNYTVENTPWYNQFDSYNGGSNKPAITINLSGLTIDGGNRIFNEKAIVNGVKFHNTGGTIENCVFKNFQNLGAVNPILKTDRAVYFLADQTSPAQLNFKNNTISDFYSFGLIGEGAGLSIILAGNKIIGNGIDAVRQRGVAVNYAKSASIDGNTISNISKYNVSNNRSYAVSAVGIANPSGIKNNLILNSNAGFLLTNCNLSIEGNEMTNPQLFGFYLQGSAGTTNISFISNKISGSETAILTATFNGAVLNLDLQENSISNALNNSILNYGGANIITTCNWFGTTDAGSVYSSIYGDATINSLLASGVDALPDTRGFQKGNVNCTAVAASLYYVNDNSRDGDELTETIGNDNNPGTKELPLATVKRAIQLAMPGSTIFVDAGDYTEQVMIKRPMNILGAGRSKTNFHLPTNMVLNYQTTGGGINYDNYAIFHAQDVNGANIQNISVDGDNASFNNGILYGIAMQRSSGVVSGCEIRNFKNNNPTNPANSTGSGIIGINFASPVRNIEVYDNIVKDFYYSGIIMSGPTVTYQVHDNIIVGNVNELKRIFQNGIEIYAGAGSVKNNSITSINASIDLEGKPSAGISVEGSSYGGAAEITGNLINTEASGIIAGNGNHIIKNNEISGSLVYGIGSYVSETINPVMTIENNIIANNNTGLYFQNFGTGTFTVEAHKNSITGSVIKSFQNVNATVNAGCNWFGTVNPTEIEYYLDGAVNFTPWLTDGEDTDQALVGFQSKDGTCTGKPFKISLLSKTDVINCATDPTGSINVLIEVGGGPLVIQWTKQGDETFNASTEDLEGITQGVYDLLATDANGETLSLQVVIDGPSTLVAEVFVEPIYCNGQTSPQVQVIASGGTALLGLNPYNIIWNDGQTTDIRTDLKAGNYTVTVTDARGCQFTDDKIFIIDPAPIAPSISATAVLCNGGATGTALVSATGGTLGVLDESTYKYLWSNGATTANVSGLSAVTYSVIVEDDYLCTGTASITIAQPSALRATTQVTNVLCNGESNGSVNVNANGGTPPYRYAIDNGAVGSANLFGSLAIGNHIVRVIDNNNCEFTASFTITQPLPIVISTPTVVATCLGSSTGSITLTATGGIGTLRYSWTGPNGFTATKAAITGLAAGAYTLTVTDANNCINSTTVTVSVASTLTISGTVTNVGCYGAATGSISLVSPAVQIGIAYAWSGPNNYKSTARDIGALKAGTYTVTIKQGACSYLQSFTVNQPSASLAMTLTKGDITSCSGLGSITVASTGGTAPYQYSINSGVFQSSGTFTGLAAGTYAVRVRDANLCLFSSSITIADNGNDPYEPNDKQTVAVAYTMNSVIKARIAPAATDIDWYKFTTKATPVPTYTVTLTHPTVRYAFDLYDSRARLVTPTTSVAGSTATKSYTNLVAGAVYSLRIQGSLSLVCYQLSITDGGALLPAVNPMLNSIATASIDSKKTMSVVNHLEASVVPNPHPGQFNLTVNSPAKGIGNITLMTASGQIISQRKLQLNKGNNTIRYENINPGMLIYRVTLNDLQTTGRIIGVK